MTRANAERSSEPRSRLGRGLDSLLPSTPAVGGGIGQVGQLQAPIGSISRNPSQPRREFDRAALEELAASIREHGILQPLLVRARASGGYELIAGERRWRAAGLAGLDMAPIVIVDESDDEESGLTLALVENLQRSDLNPIELAAAFEQLAEAGWTQERIARQVGKSRAAVANALRLRRLTDALQAMVASGALSEGHGRALLGAPETERPALAKSAIDGSWTVRQLEDAVRALAQPTTVRAARTSTPAMRQAARQLEAALGTRVEVRAGARGAAGGGRIVVRWYDEEQLAELAERIAGRGRASAGGAADGDDEAEFGI